MKKANKILWGIVLIAVGVVFALKALGITEINIFFKGWWTLFLIIPSLIGLFTERKKTGNIIVLLIGVALLLGSWDIISFALIWKLLVPAVIIIIGIKMIFGGISNEKASGLIENAPTVYINATCLFGGVEIE